MREKKPEGDQRAAIGETFRGSRSAVRFRAESGQVEKARIVFGSR